MSYKRTYGLDEDENPPRLEDKFYVTQELRKRLITDQCRAAALLGDGQVGNNNLREVIASLNKAEAYLDDHALDLLEGYFDRVKQFAEGPKVPK